MSDDDLPQELTAGSIETSSATDPRITPKVVDNPDSYTTEGPLPTSIPVEKQLQDALLSGLSPKEAVRELQLFSDISISAGSGGKFSSKLTNSEAYRLILGQKLTDTPAYKLAEQIKNDAVREDLGLSETVSEGTIYNIEERIGEPQIPQLESIAENIAMWAEEEGLEIADLRDAPEPEDVDERTGIPELVKLTRIVKVTGYACVQLSRTDSRYEKWEIFKPYEVASHHSIHPNNARATLRKKPCYWGRKTPTQKALWNQVRERSREDFRAMFICAFEQYLDLLDRYNLYPAQPDVAVDLTGWPWFGAVDNSDQPEGAEGTKPGRNYSHSWSFATISLVGVPVPMTLAARSVEERKQRDDYLAQLLNYADAAFDVGRVFLDKGFYTTAAKDELKQRDQDFIITARRKMDAFETLVASARQKGDSWASQPYEMGTGVSDDPDHYLFVNPSEKRLKRTDTGRENPKNWEAYYTNINPEAVDGGGAAMATDYRLRWGIETSYRVLKHEFLPKSASTMRNQRVFLFNWAILLNNMWMSANVIAAANKRDYDAADTDEPLQVKDNKGRYEYTANEFMTALLDDHHPVDIGEVDNLSKRSEILANTSEFDLAE